MKRDGLFGRSLMGGAAAAGVFTLLYAVAAGLSSPWFLVMLPVLALFLGMVGFPAAIVLALPLAALLRAWRPFLATVLGTVWMGVPGAALALRLGAGPDEAFLIATVLVPSGAALGLGVIWPLRPAPPAPRRAARSPGRPSPRGSGHSGRGSPPGGAR